MFSRVGRLLHSILREVRLATCRVFTAKTPSPKSHAVSLQPELSTTETPPPKSHAVSFLRDIFTTETLPPQSIAVSLPPEIVSLILSHLTPESVVAFGLTCRRFYAFVPSPPRLTEETRQILLQWLEKDTPSLYWCHRCNSLHTWRRVENRHRQGIVQYDKNCRKREHCHPSPRPPHRSYRLTFSLARVVMNRHLYGDLHGPPLETLSHDATYAESPQVNGVMQTESWTARIIGDGLYLRAKVQVYQEQGLARRLRDHLDEAYGQTRIVVCHHLGLLARSSRDGWCYLSEVKRETGSADLFVPVTGTLKSCHYCFTDYRVDVRWHPLDGSSGGPKGWVISITRWHRLGGCRSTHDVEWDNYGREYAYQIAAWKTRFKSCHAGMVYRDWNEAARGDDAEVDAADQAANARFC